MSALSVAAFGLQGRVELCQVGNINYLAFSRKKLTDPRVSTWNEFRAVPGMQLVLNNCVLWLPGGCYYGAVLACTKGLFPLPWISKAGLLADGDTKNDNQDDGHPLCVPLSALNIDE